MIDRTALDEILALTPQADRYEVVGRIAWYVFCLDRRGSPDPNIPWPLPPPGELLEQEISGRSGERRRADKGLLQDIGQLMGQTRLAEWQASDEGMREQRRLMDEAFARKAETDGEMGRLCDAYRTGRERSPKDGLEAALRHVERLRAANPELARRIAYRVVAFLKGCNWPEATAADAGVLAGLGRRDAARWAGRLSESP